MGCVAPEARVDEPSETCSIGTELGGSGVSRSRPTDSRGFERSSVVSWSLALTKVQSRQHHGHKRVRIWLQNAETRDETWIQEVEPVRGGPSGPDIKEVEHEEQQTGRREGPRTFRVEETTGGEHSAGLSAILVPAAISTMTPNQSGSSPVGCIFAQKPRCPQQAEKHMRTKLKPNPIFQFPPGPKITSGDQMFLQRVLMGPG